MVYIRNYQDDSDLSQIFLALKDAIQKSDNDIIIKKIKRNMPEMADWVQEGSGSIGYTDSPMVEQFLCDCLDILLKAREQKNTQLIYELSDMLQAIPNPEYWESSKSMRNYWKNYIKPVKKKWRIDRLDYIKKMK